MKVALLREATARLLPAIDSKGIVKEFTYFYFNGDCVEATNGSLLIRSFLSEKSPVFAVEALTFYSLLKSLPDEDVEIIVNEKTVELKTKTVKSELTLPGTPAKSTIDFNIEAWGEVPGDLIHALGMCRYTACPDQTAGSLTGVRIEGDVVLSCDRWRISIFNLAKATGMSGATLPVDLIDELTRFAKTINGWAIKGNTIYFRMEKAIMGAQLLGGDFPTVKLLDAIAMTESSMELKLSKDIKAKIADASARQNIIQEKIMEYDRQSKFTFENNKVILFALNEAVGKIEEEIACPDSPKAAFTFYVNPVFLLKMFEETDQLTYSAEHSVASFLGPQFVHMVKTKAPAAA